MTEPTKSDRDDPAPQAGASASVSEANADAQSGESAPKAESASRAPRRAGTALLWFAVLIAFCLLGFEWFDTRALEDCLPPSRLSRQSGMTSG
jgi:hypothetical protein